VSVSVRLRAVVIKVARFKSQQVVAVLYRLTSAHSLPQSMPKHPSPATMSLATRHPLHPITTTHLSPRSPSSTTTATKPSTPAQPAPAFALLAEVQRARPAVRYTLYAGFGLMVAAESTFWYNVLRANFFPPAVETDEHAANDRFLADLRDAVKGYRAVCMSNYASYYGAYLWGLGYGGLHGLEREL
jgi:hypothetical protein